MCYSIKAALMARDGLTAQQAEGCIADAVVYYEAGAYGEDVELCLLTEFSLGMNYSTDFLARLLPKTDEVHS